MARLQKEASTKDLTLSYELWREKCSEIFKFAQKCSRPIFGGSTKSCKIPPNFLQDSHAKAKNHGCVFSTYS